MIDTHTHTMFSDDSMEQPGRLIETAIERGIAYLAITDHVDRDYLFGSLRKVKQIDFHSYIKEMLILKERYKDKITLAIGAEFGYSPEASDMYSDINAKYPNLDIVINSVHTVNCRDAYFPDFFDGLSKESAYLSYLDAVKNSIDAPYDYNVIAHIGYVTRNAPYLDKAMKYNDYKDIIDEILLNIINKNKALEVNSRSVSHDSPFMPSKEILVRYKELKGEMVTFASDAHIAADAGKGYKDVTDFLTKIGYKHLTAFVQRKPVFYDI